MISGHWVVVSHYIAVTILWMSPWKMVKHFICKIKDLELIGVEIYLNGLLNVEVKAVYIVSFFTEAKNYGISGVSLEILIVSVLHLRIIVIVIVCNVRVFFRKLIGNRVSIVTEIKVNDWSNKNGIEIFLDIVGWRSKIDILVIMKRFQEDMV